MTDRRKPEMIEDEIERTRSRIESRLDNLSGEFSPGGLFNQFLGNDARNPSDTVNVLVQKARENPFSALMIGAGLAGMVLGNRENDDKVTSPDRGVVAPYSDDPAERLSQNAAALKTQVDAAGNDISERASEMTESAKAAATNAQSMAKDAVKGVADYASDTVSSLTGSARNTYDKASDAAHDARDAITEGAKHAPARARSGTEEAVEWVKENLVPAGLFALAAGAVVASVFTAKKPSSRLDASRELHEEAREGKNAPDALRTPKSRSRAKPKARSRKTTTKTRPVVAKSPLTRAPLTKSPVAKAKAVKPKSARSKSAETSPRKPLGGPKNIARSTAVLGTDDKTNSV